MNETEPTFLSARNYYFYVQQPEIMSVSHVPIVTDTLGHTNVSSYSLRMDDIFRLNINWVSAFYTSQKQNISSLLVLSRIGMMNMAFLIFDLNLRKLLFYNIEKRDLLRSYDGPFLATSILLSSYGYFAEKS